MFRRWNWQNQPGRLVGLALVTAACAVPAWAQWGASGSLFTEDGIELTVNAGVTSTFAMLNALGYDREVDYGPEPLRRPNFSKAREEAREQFGRPGPALKDLKDVVKKYERPVEVYLDAALRLGKAPSFAPPQRRTKKLTRALEDPVRKWYGEEGGAAIFRNVVRNSKKDQRALRDPLNALAKRVTKAVPVKSEEDQLLDEESAEKERVIVVLNHLDAHNTLYRLDVNGTQYVVIGPFKDKKALTAARDAAAYAHARTLVERDLAKAKLDGTWADEFDKLDIDHKRDLRGKDAYASELIACALLRVVDSTTKCRASLVPKANLEGPTMDLVLAGVKTWQTNKSLLRTELDNILGRQREPVEPTPPEGTAANPTPAAPQKTAPAKKPAG